MKKTISLLLVFVLSFCMFTACGKEGSKPEPKPEEPVSTPENTSTTPEEITIPDYEQENAFTLSGQTVVVNVAFRSDTLADDFFNYRADTILNEKARARFAQIEKDFDCTLKYTEYLMGDANSEFVNNSAAGMFYANIYQNETFSMISPKKEGYLLPMSEVSDIIDVNDSDKWGSRSLLLDICWENDVYGVFPNAWVGQLLNCYGYPIVVNNDRLKEAGLSDLREYVEGKVWNWKNFTQTLKDATMRDGENIIYAMAVHSPYLTQNLLLTNGVSIGELNESGEYACGYFTTPARNAFNYVRNIYLTECADCFDKKNTSPPKVIEAFIDENCVFCTGYAGDIFGTSSKLTYTVDNLAIIPWPYGDDGGPAAQYNTFHESVLGVITIPTVQGELEYEDTATVINALFEPIEGYETKDEIYGYYTDNIFFDKRDVDYFLKMVEGSSYNFFNEGLRTFPEQVLNAPSKEISQLEELNRSRLEKKFTNDVLPAYLAADKIFGEITIE